MNQLIPTLTSRCDRSLAATVCMLAALVYIVGCTGTTVSLYQTSITVSPASATVQLGQSTVFTANVNTQSLSSTAVTWQVNGVTGGSTTLGTISASGLYTAPLAMPASSSVTITAIAQADTTKSASAIITLTQPPTSVSIAPLTATVQLGLTQTFTATVINDLQNKGSSGRSTASPEEAPPSAPSPRPASTLRLSRRPPVPP